MLAISQILLFYILISHNICLQVCKMCSIYSFSRVRTSFSQGKSFWINKSLTSLWSLLALFNLLVREALFLAQEHDTVYKWGLLHVKTQTDEYMQPWLIKSGIWFATARKEGWKIQHIIATISIHSIWHLLNERQPVWACPKWCDISVG